jgi:glycosyltransferase involved in cell wall biosynthesis
MARLLIVTDATFYRSGDQVFDRVCFDRRFFDDYCAEFDEVRVAARVADRPPDAQLHRADGEGLRFVDLPAVSGALWALAPRSRYCGALDQAVGWADAICLRLPGVAGWHAGRLARRQRKPVMFELIGDPLAVGLGSVQARLYGRLQGHRTRRTVRRCQLGSYVSASHLQQLYPAAPGATTAAISSIRLDRARLRPPRTGRWRNDRLRLIHVGSFLPVKNQALLVKMMRLAHAESLPIYLTLVGDGETRARIERQIRAHCLDERITLAGHLPGSELVMAAMVEADALIMPSLSEGLPRVVLEAMAAGLPVVGSDVPGIRQLLPHWLLFDPAVAADALERCRLLLDDGSYRRAAAYGSSKVREFTDDVLSTRRRALLAELRQLVTAPDRRHEAAATPGAIVLPDQRA